MIFNCDLDTEKGKEHWYGAITKIEQQNNCYEIFITGRSRIMVIFGTTSSGGFVCCPDFNVGCHLANLKDKFWNTERLINILGPVDGITVAAALFALANKYNL